MESECENIRRWLLQAERYEDVKRFDSSIEERERFCRERGSYHYHNNVVMIETKIPKEREDVNIIEMMQERINYLERMLRIQKQRIKDKDAIIDLLKDRL